jgi:hypothetical protein
MCANELCIYEEEGFCIYDSIELDECGSCSIRINIEEKLLRKIKEQMRKELESKKI